MRTPISAMPNARRPVICVATAAGAQPILTAAQLAGLSSFAHVIALSQAAFELALNTSDETFNGLLQDSLENVVVVGVDPANWKTFGATLAAQNFGACYVAGTFFPAKRLCGTLALYLPTAQLLNQMVSIAVNYEGGPGDWSPAAQQDLATFAGVYSIATTQSGLLAQSFTTP